MSSPAIKLYSAGYRDLVSVAPPGAPIRPGSRLSPTQLGKAPARWTPQGWSGYSWAAHRPDMAEVRAWAAVGANIGLRGDGFPALDIDSLDEELARRVERLAIATLGEAPVRVGRAPKRLLVYATLEPFPRKALIVRGEGVSHLVEMLGAGRQYLVHGTHPSGAPYAWLGTPLWEIPPQQLTHITAEQVESFFALLASEVREWGVPELVGGTQRSRDVVVQRELEAPSLDALEECVRYIPNRPELVPDRDGYIKIGCAIKAAGQADESAALAIFAAWAARYEGTDGRVAGNPDTPVQDWRRMRPPFAVGWPWLCELAAPFGFAVATTEFSPLPAASAEAASPRWSDRWLAEQIVARLMDRLRYVRVWGRWLVWEEGRWQRDETGLAEHLIGLELRSLAMDALRDPTLTPSKANSYAQRVASSGTLTAVAKLAQADPALSTSVASLDADAHLLNTPGGIVDLRTGELTPADPGALQTKRTRVAPDATSRPERWLRFLEEATGGDPEYVGYLQRLAGYALTGSTEEHALAYLWGPGGNGKSVFLRALYEVLGDYAVTAEMSVFLSKTHEGHSVEVAYLAGARLVTASELEAGRRWNEARLKSLTGGDKVTARFLYGQPFEFTPQFKLVFAGNHRPEIRDVDAAMRRRIHLLPFTVTPANPDRALDAKLRAEYPAILAWAIEGCLEWRRTGLRPPERVRAETEEYFSEEDVVESWLAERCVLEPGAFAATEELLADWRDWAALNGAWSGASSKWLVARLRTKRLERGRDPMKRRGLVGIRLKTLGERS